MGLYKQASIIFIIFTKNITYSNYSTHCYSSAEFYHWVGRSKVIQQLLKFKLRRQPCLDTKREGICQCTMFWFSKKISLFSWQERRITFMDSLWCPRRTFFDLRLLILVYLITLVKDVSTWKLGILVWKTYINQKHLWDSSNY